MIAVMKVAGDLERVGDMSKNIAKRSLVISRGRPHKANAGVARMGRASLRQLSDILNAYQANDVAAAEAVELFCYRARAHLAALTASLSGLDRLVFTAGIGAHSPEIRERICSGLEYLGLRLDRQRNQRNERLISDTGSTVVIEAFATDEESTIGRHVYRLLAQTHAH